MHYDCDAFFEDRSFDKEKHFIELNMLKNTNADFVSMEYSILYDALKDDGEYIPLLKNDQKIMTGKYASADEILKEYVDWGHKNGIKLYATERMSLANFHAPYSDPNFRKNFITENPQYYCKSRNGNTINVCSYAYEKVRDYVLENMLRMIEMGFDGISMIFHRGIHIAFEKPVLDRFAKLYPGLDPRLLPITDKRLKSVWCEFMTDFLRTLRKRLDGWKKCKNSVQSAFCPITQII